MISSLSSTLASSPSAAPSSNSPASGPAFADLMTGTTSAAAAESPAAGKADVVYGRIGVDYKKNGYPYRMVFFDEQGNKMGHAAYDPVTILTVAERLEVPLDDLVGLADKMDEAKVRGGPYQVYAGTGSDAGIDLRDLASGGLGTAYDWRVDHNAAQKGSAAAAFQADAQALADRLGLVANPEVTNGGGLRLASLEPQTGGDGTYRPYVVTNGGWAAWYATRPQAQAAATASAAALLDLTQTRPII